MIPLTDSANDEAKEKEQTKARMKSFEVWCSLFRYRPVTTADLLPCARLLMVHLERSMSGQEIRLDEVPVRPSKGRPNKGVVYYHHLSVSGKSFCAVEDFCAWGYVERDYANDFRYVVKI